MLLILWKQQAWNRTSFKMLDNGTTWEEVHSLRRSLPPETLDMMDQFEAMGKPWLESPETIKCLEDLQMDIRNLTTRVW